MKIITVCNFKGGVGKTTLITGFARILAQNNFSILLIDLDPQANLTSVLQVFLKIIQILIILKQSYDLKLQTKQLKKI